MNAVVRNQAAEQRLRELEFASGMLAEIQQMMQANGEKTLAYLIEMAYIEACDRRRELNERMPREQQSRPVKAA
jgi:hypothetical protein